MDDGDKTLPADEHDFQLTLANIQDNPRQPEQWRRLVSLAENSGDLDRICTAYDALLKQYPNTASAQIAYINHFVHSEETYKKAEDLFQRFLKASPCVELWIFYLTYVRRTNTGQSQYDTVCKSYEFALSHVGQDKDSGEIWTDYIQFLKSSPTNGTWEEQQKMDALRKVYHRAVQIPLENVEKLWQELEAFESSLNKTVAKKFMNDLSPAYMQARSVLRQLSTHLNGLSSTGLGPGGSSGMAVGAGPNDRTFYLPHLPKFDPSERSLVGKWKAYLKWEESNPLELEDKDRNVLIQRIQCVYRKAVIRMRYYTEIWFMAYTWLVSVGKNDEAVAMLKAGLEANPSSFLLSFTYAEVLELKKDYTEVHAVYDRLLTVLRQNLETFEQQSSTTNPPTSANPLGPSGPSIANLDATQSSSFSTQPDSQSANLNNSSMSSNSSQTASPKTADLAKHRTEYGVVWIMYIRFARRAEGQKSQRATFAKARRDTKWTPWEVYEAAALMEYHCSLDASVAGRIFEKGMDCFGDEVEYVVRYLGFLISINDLNNARALFERVINTFPAEKARPLWERWARYEYTYGDLEASLKLERRIAEVYPNDPPIKRFAQRHMYLGTDAIADRDLGFANARLAASGSSSASLGPNDRSSTTGAAAGGRSAQSALGRTETMQSLLNVGGAYTNGAASSLPSNNSNASGGAMSSASAPTGSKRAASPDVGPGTGPGTGRGGRDDRDRRSLGGAGPGGGGTGGGVGANDHMNPPASKRARAGSPSVGGRDRDRDWGGRAGGPGARRGFSPPPGGGGGGAGWDREDRRGGGRDDGHHRGGGSMGGAGAAKVPTIPPIISWFVGQLPNAEAFDGPFSAPTTSSHSLGTPSSRVRTETKVAAFASTARSTRRWRWWSTTSGLRAVPGPGGGRKRY